MRNITILLFMMLIINIKSYGQINLSQMGVGINKLAPIRGLDVKGGSGGNLRIDNGGEQFTGLEFLNNSQRRGLIDLDATNNEFRFISEKADQNLNFYTGGFNKRVTINAIGQIGIGGSIHPEYQYTFTPPTTTLKPIVFINNLNGLSFYDYTNS